MAELRQGSGSYEKEMQRSLQNQFSRVEKQQMMGVNIDDPKDIAARMPEQPADDVKVLCMYCGKPIPSPADVPQDIASRELVVKNVERARKFRCCQNCRNQIVGNGGILDRSTPNLDIERDLK